MPILKNILVVLKAALYLLLVAFIPYFFITFAMVMQFGGMPPSPYNYVMIGLLFPFFMLAVYLAPKLFKNYEGATFPNFPYKALLPYIIALALIWVANIIIAVYFPHFLVKFPLEPKTLLEFTLLFIIVLVLAPLAEELLFRDFLYKIFGQMGGKWASLIIPSLLFALMHGLSPVKLALTFAAGMTLGLARHNLNSLKASWDLHILNNAVAFIFLLLNWIYS